jgi:formylglycine-generating enzyme required for sulfatase activity
VIQAWLLILSAAAGPAARPELVRIPPGAFGGSVFATSFWMQKTEVTVDQFASFVKATGHRSAAERAGASRTWRKPGFRVEGRQPVVYVSFGDAEAYCGWVGARLPTDDEWEYAARAGSTARHYWGDAIDDRYLWYRANSDGHPHEVGTKLPNAWGLYDMEGNVWEWSVSPGAGEATIANRRGASWIACEDIDGGPGGRRSPLVALATFFRIPARLDHRYDDIGFRCARSAP